LWLDVNGVCADNVRHAAPCAQLFFWWFFDALKCELICCGAHLGGHECLSYVFYVIAVFCDMR
jgi:hypothetical protein